MLELSDACVVIHIVRLLQKDTSQVRCNCCQYSIREDSAIHGPKCTHGVVDIGITSTKSPALDIAALCLNWWLAAIFAQVSISDSCQRLHVSL